MPELFIYTVYWISKKAVVKLCLKGLLSVFECMNEYKKYDK
jgi:hypothetical protein